MSKKSAIPASRHHLMIYDDDWEYLETRYGPGSGPKIGTGVVIRNMIRVYVKSLREKEEAKMEALRVQYGNGEQR